ncbi:ABC transporter substrate-binding protein [Henriciella litoralis]|uniref:ABC transporter substrate-binding protein n=1 Tax=Henriciella litoralis TaxID=568102 RepID=UPI000A04CC99|nr:ABC transporter substrate-binding protein [Henriciella litoralis]
MSRLAILSFIGFGLAACGDPPTPQVKDGDRPMRIVSLDYCADQYVLKLADEEQVLAISPDAVKDFSYMREEAVGVPTVRPIAEDVLILKPDLVVRAYGGGPNAEAFFERAGVPVLTVGWTSNVDSEEVGSIPNLIQHMADGLGQSERGRQLVTDFRARLAAIDKRTNGETALYLTPAGVTTGPGAMVHEMLVSAGFENFEEQPGWRSIPLERLAYERPDVIAAAFFEQKTNHPDSWSPMKHPVAERQMDELTVVPLKGAWTACGGWFILDAIEALAEGGAS